MKGPAQRVLVERAGAHVPAAIELSRAQVDGIVRRASSAGNMSALLSGLADVREVLESSPVLDDPRLSRSLLSGLLMLAVMPADGRYIGNAELCMPLSTAHRYLSTLVATGLVEREPTTRKYRVANAG